MTESTLVIQGPSHISLELPESDDRFLSTLAEGRKIFRCPQYELWENSDQKHFQKLVAPLLVELFQKELMKRLMMAQTVYWYVPSKSLLGSQFLLGHIRKILPDLKLVLFGPEMGRGELRNLLRAGLIQGGVTRFETKVFEGLESWFKSFDEEEIPEHALVLRPDGVIRFKKPEHLSRKGNYRVMLLLAPAWNNDYPPYGLAHISGALKEQGHHVRCLDYNARFWDKLVDKYGHCADFEHMQIWSNRDLYNKRAREDVEAIFHQVFEEIEKFQPESIGLSIFETNILTTWDFLKILREKYPDIKTFIGGPSVTNKLSHDFISSQLLDAAILGEGEITVCELVQAWEKGDSLSELSGANLNVDGKFVGGPSRPLAKIDELPLPDFSEFDLYNYSEFMLPIFLSRGCVAKCSFCYETQYWKKFRIKTPEAVFHELKQSYELYGIHQFRVNDSLMNGSHRLLEEFADLIIKSDLMISYTGYCRLDPRLNKTLLQKLALSGCREISFGMESASQVVLDNMDKETHAEDFDEIIMNTYHAGISVMVCIMVGFPGEGWKEYFQTLFKIIKLRKYINQLNLSIFIPGDGTPIWDNSEKYHIDLYDPATGFWKSKDGKNNQKVREFRYYLFKRIWYFLKRKKDSQYKWEYGKLQEIS